jgi:hypothetical protein
LGYLFSVACASIGNPNLLCRCSQNGKACFASILLADVVSVGSRVIRYHNGLLIVDVMMYFVVCGEADMLVLVDLFNPLVECRAKTVGRIVATLGKTNACCATLDVGSVDCHTFLVAVAGFGQAAPFILCEGNAVVEEQAIAIAQSPEHLLNVLLPGYLALPMVFSCIRGYDGYVVAHLQWWGTHVLVGQMHYAMWV